MTARILSFETALKICHADQRVPLRQHEYRMLESLSVFDRAFEECRGFGGYGGLRYDVKGLFVTEGEPKSLHALLFFPNLGLHAKFFTDGSFVFSADQLRFSHSCVSIQAAVNLIAGLAKETGIARIPRGTLQGFPKDIAYELVSRLGREPMRCGLGLLTRMTQRAVTFLMKQHQR